MYSLLLGNNRQCMPVCAKTVSSWVRNILGITKGHMSPGTLCGAVMSAALVTGVSLVSILQAGDWASVSTPTRYSFPLTSLLQISTRIQFNVLSWVSVSNHNMAKCQTLTYIKSSKYVEPLGHRPSQYQAKRLPIVCVVLALDSWNYCSGEQGLTAQHPPLNVCLYGFMELEAVGFPVMCHLVARKFA